MEGLDPSTVIFTEHFKKQCWQKGFDPKKIVATIRNPDRITDVTRYPGQKRFIGNGLAIIMRGNTAITAYLDNVVTPLRPDQIGDPEAMNSNRLRKKGFTG